MHVQNCEKKWGVEFSSLEISILFLIYAKSTPECFLIFLVSSSVCDRKIFIKKYWVASLVCKALDAVDGKKWVTFVAMQQDSATLIYDLRTNVAKA